MEMSLTTAVNYSQDRLDCTQTNSLASAYQPFSKERDQGNRETSLTPQAASMRSCIYTTVRSTAANSTAKASIDTKIEAHPTSSNE